MAKYIDSLSVTNFRSFKSFHAEGFGGVNLVTGKNNSGKSTLLESIRILASDGSLSVMQSILNYREEGETRQEDSSQTITPEDYSAFCSLFSGCPSLADCFAPFVIEAVGSANGVQHKVSASIGWFEEQYDQEEGTRRWVASQMSLFDDNTAIPAFVLESRNRKRIVRIDRPFRYRRSLAESVEAPAIPSVYLDPFSSRTTAHLASLWDSVALTPAEGEVLRALQVVSPDIEAVSMVGGDGAPLRTRTAIVRSSRFGHPVPLRSYGDGMNRLFGLMLSLSCAKGGILLVDEIENGLHHTILPDVWKIIFALAVKLRVQIFATTHSWDCVAAFQQAAAETPEEGVLLRLTKQERAIIATGFREDELAIATKENIEIR
jgi:energy-coupling factor transporter ATP-binding protein EcfA2